MRGEEKEVRRAAEQLGKQGKINLANVMGSVLKTGVLPKEQLGYDNSRMESIYGQAYRLYNTGKYMDAITLFQHLIVLDSTEVKYYMGLAACCHMLKDYLSAVKVYMYAAAVDPENPIPFFHASDCYLQMRDKASALLMLEMAVKHSKDKPEYQILKDRALMSIEGLKKEIMQLENVK